MSGEYCPTCGETTDTHYKEVETGYVMHICEQCGADKRKDPKAPV